MVVTDRVRNVVRDSALSGISRLPTPVLRRFLRRSTRDLGVALCLHRVSDRRPRHELQPAMRITTAALDRLLGYFAGPGGDTRSPGKLTVTFDDGYQGAAEYVKSRAPRFPHVEWLFFVCPEKTEHRVGYRWDVMEHNQPHATLEDLLRELDRDLDLDAENKRPELHDVARLSAYRLASRSECLRLAELPNVRLGNHTNNHFNFSRLSSVDCEREIARSQGAFEASFGACQHFAFPFGSPGLHVTDAHVEAVAAQTDALIWSTAASPYELRDRRPGVLLPRFPVFGTWEVEEVVAWVAVQCARFRARRKLRISY